MPPAILLFLKYPEPGKVKTRLAVTVGNARATEIYCRLVEEVCIRLPEHGADLFAMFDPPNRGDEIERWLAELCDTHRFTAVPQAAGDLGARLTAAFNDAFARGYSQVAAIGSDCVELCPHTFTETWRAFDNYDVVLGPTHDGGYYLVAVKSPRAELFTDIAWSTGEVLRQTLAAAHLAGLRVYQLPELHDVDTEEDWRRAEARLSR